MLNVVHTMMDWTGPPVTSDRLVIENEIQSAVCRELQTDPNRGQPNSVSIIFPFEFAVSSGVVGCQFISDFQTDRNVSVSVTYRLVSDQ
jgi:hypothetical protein